MIRGSLVFCALWAGSDLGCVPERSLTRVYWNWDWERCYEQVPIAN